MSCAQAASSARYVEYERPTAIIVEHNERFLVCLTVQLMNNEEAVAVIIIIIII